MFAGNIDLISLDDIHYYRERHRNRVFSAVIERFAKLVETTGLTKREIAVRLKKDPAQITRWLSGPSNWTLDTGSDLLLAMGAELDQAVAEINEKTKEQREVHPLAQSYQKANVIVIYPKQQNQHQKVQAATSARSIPVRMVNCR